MPQAAKSPDARSNTKVTAALRALGDALVSRGARVQICALPDVYDDGRKTGLDDLLVMRGSAALDQAMERAEALALGSALWRLNEEVVFVRDPGVVVEIATGLQISVDRFTTAHYANRWHDVVEVDKRGADRLKRVKSAPAWVSWPNRREAAGLSYEPGAGVEATDRRGAVINTWSGWGCTPVAGDVRPWTWLLDRLFGAGEEAEAARGWFERWCACPLQRPGTKLYSAALMLSRIHGSGKSLLGVLLGRVYGQNFAVINDGQLASEDNDWGICKQLVMVDDMEADDARDRRKRGGAMRTRITQPTLWVNIKYVPRYAIRDVINYYMTGNKLLPFVLDDDDRRFFVWHSLAPRLTREEKDMVVGWADDPAGPAALFAHLLALDLGDFDPAGPALWTSAKKAMITDSRGELASAVARLRDDPDMVLRTGEVVSPRALWTNAELRALLDPEGVLRITANALGRELREAGIELAARGAVLSGRARRAERYYAVRDTTRWAAATPRTCQAHLRGTLA